MSSRKFTVSEIKFEAFSHATEDPRKVEKAILNLIPEDSQMNIKIMKSRVEGYYGNPILILKVVIRDKDLIKRVIEYIASRMDSLDKKLLESTFDLRVNKSKNLYMRFDKDDAYSGKLTLSDSSDVIKVTISFSSIRRKDDLIKVCRELGFLPAPQIQS